MENKPEIIVLDPVNKDFEILDFSTCTRCLCSSYMSDPGQTTTTKEEEP